MTKVDLNTPVGKAFTFLVVTIIVVLTVIALEDIRKSQGNNPVVNDTINKLEGNIIGNQPQQIQSNPWKTAFIILGVLVIIIALVVIIIKMNEDYSGDFLPV